MSDSLIPAGFRSPRSQVVSPEQSQGDLACDLMGLAFMCVAHVCLASSSISPVCLSGEQFWFLGTAGMQLAMRLFGTRVPSIGNP